MVSGPSFIIGDYSDSSEDEGLHSPASAIETTENGTQTESRAPTPPPEGEPRSLEECVAIMKGDVSTQMRFLKSKSIRSIVQYNHVSSLIEILWSFLIINIIFVNTC